MPPRAHRIAVHLLLAVCAMATLAHAGSALPQRDLIVELRVAAGADASAGWDVSSADAARDRVAQRLRVRNGHSATLRHAATRPVQTWQALPGVWGAAAVPATQWITAGRELIVQPRWPGGAQPVGVTLRMASEDFDPGVASGSAEPPRRTGVQLETTVSVALGAWITLATEGAPGAQDAVVSSRDASPAMRALQLRVTLAPR